MSNFAKKLEDATEEDLKNWINELDFRVVPLASDELTRRNLKKLQKAIKENTKKMADFANITTSFNKNTSSQTDRIISLSKLIVVLTLIMVIAIFIQIRLVFVQIDLAKVQVGPILSEQKRNEQQAYEYCKTSPKGSWPSASGGEIKCSEVLEMLEEKFK